QTCALPISCVVPSGSAESPYFVPSTHNSIVLARLRPVELCKMAAKRSGRESTSPSEGVHTTNPGSALGKAQGNCNDRRNEADFRNEPCESVTTIVKV